MKRAMVRTGIVGFSCLTLFELLSQASVHWRESSGELGMTALYVFLGAGLVWACLPAFPERRLRYLFRCLLVIALLLGTHTIVCFYSWHVRPNIGLYEEPEWVAQHSAFQEQMRERIKRNKW